MQGGRSIRVNELRPSAQIFAVTEWERSILCCAGSLERRLSSSQPDDRLWPYKVVGPGVTAPMQSPLKPIIAADAIDVITFVVSLVD